MQASFVSYLGGTVTMLICLILGGTSVLPSASLLGGVRWWQLTGGMFGAFYVCAIIVTAVKIGSANMFSLMVAGQLLLAVLFDHFGLLGFNVHKVTVARFCGIVLLVAGVYVIQRN
jgi:transporter family-2 protein